MINFFHTADFHFGVENYGKIDPQTGIHTRLLDFKATLEICVTQAINDNIDFFLFCGDAYKTPIPTPTHQKVLITQLLRLYHAHIPVIIVVGNHDHPLSFGKSHALDIFDYLPVDGFHVIAKPTIIRLTTKQGPVQIVGIPWPTRNHIVSTEAHRHKNNAEIATYVSEQVGNIITSLASQLDYNIPAILAGHLTVSSGIFSGSEKCAIYGNDPIFLPSQLAQPPFDYVALGHLHRYQNLNKQGYPAIVYSGSLERIDFGERKEEKGYCHVTINTKAPKHERCTHQFIQVQTRPMLQIEMHLEPHLDATQQLIEKLKQYDLADAIVKILYHIPPTMTEPKVDFYEINRACINAHHVVGVFPVYQPIAKERRATLSVTMDVDTLLTTYFDHKQLTVEKKERILKKALQLIANNQAENIAHR